MKLLAFLISLVTFQVLLADEPLRDLKKIEAALEKSPDDPMLHYRKCQALFADGKEQESIDHANIAISKFKAKKNDLAWMKLGTFTTKRYRIDVHYNMGPKERSEEKDGIVRPYSFRVWKLADEPELVKILDFELGYTDGVAVTAAIGEMTKRGHSNYGIVDPDSDFASIKEKILELLAN